MLTFCLFVCLFFVLYSQIAQFGGLRIIVLTVLQAFQVGSSV